MHLYGNNKLNVLYFQRYMRIVVNKQWRVYLDLGRAGSLRFTVILNLPQITAYARGSE